MADGQLTNTEHILERLARVETRLDSLVWVNDALRQVQGSLLKVEGVLERLAENQKRQDERQAEIDAAHSALLAERAEREREEGNLKLEALQAQLAAAKDGAFLKKVARVAPLFSVMTGTLALLTAAAAGLIWVIQHAPK